MMVVKSLIKLVSRKEKFESYKPKEREMVIKMKKDMMSMATIMVAMTAMESHKMGSGKPIIMRKRRGAR